VWGSPKTWEVRWPCSALGNNVLRAADVEHCGYATNAIKRRVVVRGKEGTAARIIKASDIKKICWKYHKGREPKKSLRIRAKQQTKNKGQRV